MEDNKSALLQNIKLLAEEFIRVPSTADNPQGLKDVLEVAKTALEGFPIESFETNGVPSLLVSNVAEEKKEFKIILNAHLDVVHADEYRLIEKDGKFYGRGAYDMKFAAAVIIFLFKELAKEVTYSLGLQLVTDEEVGGFCGTKYQIDQGVRGEFVIAGDFSDLKIQNKAKGIFWLKVKTRGQAAHGAYPWKGENALGKLQMVLEKLQMLYPHPEEEVWRTTVNVSKIETPNVSFNKVPDEATAFLDIRFVPEEKDSVVETVKSVIGSDAEVEIILNEPAQYTSEDNFYVKHLRTSLEKITGSKAEMIQLHGGADVRFYEQLGVPAVCFGPHGGGQHAVDEWVEKESIYVYYRILRDFLLTIR